MFVHWKNQLNVYILGTCEYNLSPSLHVDWDLVAACLSWIFFWISETTIRTSCESKPDPTPGAWPDVVHEPFCGVSETFGVSEHFGVLMSDQNWYIEPFCCVSEPLLRFSELLDSDTWSDVVYEIFLRGGEHFGV